MISSPGAPNCAEIDRGASPHCTTRVVASDVEAGAAVAVATRGVADRAGTDVDVGVPAAPGPCADTAGVAGAGVIGAAVGNGVSIAGAGSAVAERTALPLFPPLLGRLVVPDGHGIVNPRERKATSATAATVAGASAATAQASAVPSRSDVRSLPAAELLRDILPPATQKRAHLAYSPDRQRVDWFPRAILDGAFPLKQRWEGVA